MVSPTDRRPDLHSPYMVPVGQPVRIVTKISGAAGLLTPSIYN